MGLYICAIYIYIFKHPWGFWGLPKRHPKRFGEISRQALPNSPPATTFRDISWSVGTSTRWPLRSRCHWPLCRSSRPGRPKGSPTFFFFFGCWFWRCVCVCVFPNLSGCGLLTVRFYVSCVPLCVFVFVIRELLIKEFKLLASNKAQEICFVVVFFDFWCIFSDGTVLW